MHRVSRDRLSNFPGSSQVPRRRLVLGSHELMSFALPKCVPVGEIVEAPGDETQKAAGAGLRRAGRGPRLVGSPDPGCTKEVTRSRWFGRWRSLPLLVKRR